ALVIALAAGGGWFFTNNFKLEGLGGISLTPRNDAAPSDPGALGMPGVQRNGNAVRIASFNIQVFGESKIAKPRVAALLAEIVRQFDIVAVQEIRSKQNILPQFVDMLNATGRHYDYVIGPRLGRTSSKEQYAFIFDTASIEIDRTALYTVNDP